MNKIKLSILDKGGSLYYTDTDSIVTDIKLEDSLVGNEIGKFKLEYEIEEGYFISNKTYAIKTKEGKVIVKSKGVYSRSLSFDDLKNLYLGNDIDAIRYETKKDYNVGSVTVKIPKTITLSPNSYTKRVKIYDNNLWINTRPITISS